MVVVKWMNILQSCLVVDIPVYLVGLKSDARPSFPMLRLGFMFEVTPTTREQVRSLPIALSLLTPN